MSNEQPIPPGDTRAPTVLSIPAALIHAFSGQVVILRAADPAQPPTLLGPAVPAGVLCVQVTDLSADLKPLVHWGEGLPLDLLMADPSAELPLLYRCTPLRDGHPVRVTVPLLPGLASAVKLAVSLGFAVRLGGHQPTQEVAQEVREALAGYLHNPTVAQPVEPFHGLLLAFLNDSPVSLWSLLEQDPAEVRVLDDQGLPRSDLGPASVADFGDVLIAAGAECCGCPWFAACKGYFKWPRTDAACTQVKPLFADLQAAATELRAGLAAYAASQGR